MKMWRLLPLAVILLAASLRANEVIPMVSGSSSSRPGAKIVFLGDFITHQGRYLRFIDEFLVNSRPGDQIRTYSAGLAKPILFSEDGDRFSGPGHNGEVFTSVDGREWMFFHAHDAALPNKGDRPTLLQELKWTDEG